MGLLGAQRALEQRSMGRIRGDLGGGGRGRLGLRLVDRLLHLLEIAIELVVGRRSLAFGRLGGLRLLLRTLRLGNRPPRGAAPGQGREESGEEHRIGGDLADADVGVERIEGAQMALGGFRPAALEMLGDRRQEDAQGADVPEELERAA